MTFRVIQWATGGVGKASIEGILKHPELELVGCWVHSEAKNGQDVGTIIGIDPVGVTASSDKAAVLAIEADCVVYAPLIPDPREIEAILRAGKNVVTPVGWFYPGEKDRRLDDAAREAGVTLHGTGINPGGITELIPLVFSSLSSAVTFVRGEEYSDIRTYAAPDVVRHIMMFGGTPDEAMGGPMLGLLSGGFIQSLRMMIDELGFDPAAEIRTSQQVAVATAPIDSPIGPIEPGLVAAQRFQWDAVLGERVIARVAVNWLMGEENLDPAWNFGPAGERFEVEVQGDPSSFVTIKGWQPETVAEGLIRNPGVTATAFHCVNSIPYVCRAEPGIKSYLDLPLIAGRAHPDLQAPDLQPPDLQAPDSQPSNL